uniref:Small integral membrane protein 26 n=1 Tax=Rhabditophanes sp. KR3021 TaxID=114890 RepID=A0AC35UFD8_9BILA
MMKWYHLEATTRKTILKCFYGVCLLTYPVFVAINYDKYKPAELNDLEHKKVVEDVMRKRG